MKIGYCVVNKTNKFYTYNRELAIKLAKKNKAEVKVVTEEKVKKAIDISI